VLFCVKYEAIARFVPGGNGIQRRCKLQLAKVKAFALNSPALGSAGLCKE
jgi:hypothetical protein